MPYTPDPTDGAAPLITVDASTAAAEFRALKTYLQTLVTGSLQAAKPAFSAYLTGNAVNVTGDGTLYTLITYTERCDIGSNFNAGTGVFTAPITGRYLLGATVEVNTLGAGHTDGFAEIVATGQTEQIYALNVAAARGVGTSSYAGSGSHIFQMTAGDTAHVAAAIYNSTKTVSVTGGISVSKFWGFLL